MNETVSGIDGVGRNRWLIVLPMVFAVYMLSYFDRVNIAMALPHMTKELGLTPVQAGWIGGAFAWGYALTQLLAGYLALKFGSRRLVAICLLLFGAAAMLTGIATTFWQIVAVRVLLGGAEGPVYAATSMLLAQWFMKPERGRAFGIWNLGAPLGGFLAGPISGALISHYDWRVMLIAEGLPAWIFCLAWFKAIPKSLDVARWLSDPDRDLIKRDLAAEQASYTKPEVDPWWTIFSEPAVWLLTIGFGLNTVLLYGTTLWLPTVMKSYGQLSETTIGFLAGAPFVMSMLGIYYISRRSDRHGQERRWHAAIPTMLTGVLMIAAAFVPAPLFYVQIALFIALGFTLKMLMPLVFARITEILPMRKAMPAVAFVSGVGNLIGQFFGPLLVGYVRAASSDYKLSLLALGVSALIGGVAIAMSKTKAERTAQAQRVVQREGAR
ncbi:MFS transporter [Paraburkholderia caballeronis]|uniref:Sugar phosphate permease n=1 Tax=Paraburkholderia caballeronis TaxID=416943 RepID=A0A1H7SVR8_9BURK|nr:MFS transporter [Paraburkholderia caballeronis]PXW25657.1 sugar phosphate permease [Paraburkholderia caballeronis]PXX01264.1 sugar phosphate permease [Paraburkholderia caballeronis]RAJ99383.1 sugar phosphate permease [Paraburkholderia caballeronis]SEE28375.1 Sugar phosphate permease [Paraburkholderia caballeronis]SEL76166.1 Sugar phosphate permease [Paraburkholderia caballeronis]